MLDSPAHCEPDHVPHCQPVAVPDNVGPDCWPVGEPVGEPELKPKHHIAVSSTKLEPVGSPYATAVYSAHRIPVHSSPDRFPDDARAVLSTDGRAYRPERGAI